MSITYKSMWEMKILNYKNTKTAIKVDKKVKINIKGKPGKVK